MHRHPLVLIGIFFGLGMWFADSVQVRLPFVVAAALAAILAAWIHRDRRNAFIWLALFLGGWCHFAFTTAILSPRDIRALMGEMAAVVTVRAEVESVDFRRTRMGADKTGISSSIVADVKSLKFERGQWQPVLGKIYVHMWGEAVSNCAAGSTIQMTGVLQPPPPALAPGLLNFREHLQHRGIYYQLTLESDEKPILLQPAGKTMGLSERFMRWAQNAMSRGLPVQDTALELQWAMVLGWKTGLTDEVTEPFARSGTMHIFAISGLHIALLAAFQVLLFRIVGISRFYCGVIIIPLIWIYTYLTGWQPSAIRSAIMSSVIIAGWGFRRPSNLMNSLFASGILILLWDPSQLFQASFQLSFMVVLCIAVMVDDSMRVGIDKKMKFDEYLRLDATRVRGDLVFWVWRWIIDNQKPDDYLIPSAVGPWRKRYFLSVKWIAGSIAVSMASFIGAFPFVTDYFHLMAPGSVLANLIVVPLSSGALVCGLGGLICGDMLPAVGELFNHCGWFFMRCMMDFSTWCAELPGAYFYVSPPPLLLYIAYLGILVYIAYYNLQDIRLRNRIQADEILSRYWDQKVKERESKEFKKNIITRIIACFVLVTIAALYLGYSKTNMNSRITVLPFKDGASIFIKPKGEHGYLVDAGRIEIAERIMIPYLHACGVERLNGLFLSHGDLGQVEGAGLLCSVLKVDELICGPSKFRSAVYKKLIAQTNSQSNFIRVMQSGDRLKDIKVLHPSTEDQFSRADDGAMVLRVENEGVRFLLLSDLGRQGQSRLMERWPVEELHCNILVTGMPTTDEPLAEAVLLAAQPQLVIVADSMYPAGMRASRKFQQRMAFYRMPVIYTRLNGPVSFECRRGAWKAFTADGVSYKSTALPHFVQPVWLRKAEDNAQITVEAL